VQRFISYQQCTRFRTTLDFDREYLWNGSSNRQAENGVSNYDFFTFNLMNFDPLTGKWPWPLTLKFNRVRAVVKVHVRAKYHQCVCSQRFISYRANKLFCVSHNVEESENTVLWPWSLTYDLEPQRGLCGCQGTCSCKISSSWAQQFTSYCANGETKKLLMKTMQSVASTWTLIMNWQYGRWPAMQQNHS